MNASDRCAGTARDGGPCTFTRAGHADGKPHAFVEPSPPPPENARAGAADEMTQRKAIHSKWMMIWRHAEDREEPVQVNIALTAAIGEAYAAGRARGIEEERKRCEGIAQLEHERDQLRAELDEAKRLLNAPEIIDFAKAIQLEAAHQRSRWGSYHDAGKTDADWFWLIGFLGGKALRTEDGVEKQLHRIITVAAAACNWHAAKLGQTNMRPGVEKPLGLPPSDFDKGIWKNDGKEPVLR